VRIVPGRSVNINIETEKTVSLDKYVKILNKIKLCRVRVIFSRSFSLSRNIPQFLFVGLLIKIARRGNFSHP